MWTKDQIVEYILKSLSEQEQSIKNQWNNPGEVQTRHAVIDNLIPLDICQEAYKTFPLNAEGFYHLDTFREKKHTTAQLEKYPLLREVTKALNDEAVVKRISELTELPTIVADPSLYAGGVTMMLKDDFLNPHIDNSHNAKRSMYRRINLLYYLNPDWSIEKGGNLELWTSKRDVPTTLVSSENRLVLMETNKHSYHSVSPVKSEAPRCCVSVYYFSPDSPERNNYFHITAFYGRPNEMLKKLVAPLDNSLRGIVAKLFKLGRGKDRVYKEEKK
jgi:Rps23 Pro-64 3,4-dihydroxylase Tpa1-like proline 4-hydroxylase